MTAVLKLVLSMSCSGGLLILVLLLGKRFWKDRISRQWQYYIWLVVILRLLLPFGPEATLLGNAYQAVDQAVAEAVSLPQRQSAPGIPEGGAVSGGGLERDNETTSRPAEDPAAIHPLQESGALLADHVWRIWLAGALGLLIRKVTIYQGFMRYIKAGLTPVSDMEALDRLAVAAERAGVRKPVELCVNPLISSPLLTGFFHPCIVLPEADISEEAFSYIILHELTHCKRRDLVYKWLVQTTVCLHWFNPLVHLMSREITNACEFSCDEAVLAKTGADSAGEYGKTLLDAMAAVGRYKEHLGTVTLSENKRLLKERLGAIMNFRKKSTAVRLLTGMLTLCVTLSAVFAGIYPAAAFCPAAEKPAAAGRTRPSPQGEAHTSGAADASLAERYYNNGAGSVPAFAILFSRMDEKTQEEWLDRIYADQAIAFMGAAIWWMDEDCGVIQRIAEKAYKDGNFAFFSALSMHMSEDTLEAWLDRALEDGNWAFQSMLFNALDREDAFDGLKEQREKEWAEAQIAEYQAAGVTMVDEKTYYYQGQLVNIFLDVRKEGSFYTLNMNPQGTVNVKIIRDADEQITGAAYMTEAEVMELLGDMSDPDDAGMELIPVNLKAIAAGETIFLGEYTLSSGDLIRYDLFAETGNQMKVFFAKDAQWNPVYWSVDNRRQSGEGLKCIGDFTVAPPAKPGTYRLYLQAPDGALGNVKGSISIAYANAS